MNLDPPLRSGLPGAGMDTTMVNGMRLLLSSATLLTLFVDPESAGKLSKITWLIFSAYTMHSLLLYVLAVLGFSLPQDILLYWLDVAWYALIVFSTSSHNNLFFLFFFFAILTSSFQRGFEEGARVTLASAGLFAATALFGESDAELSRLLLRTTFLLALGYMIAYWGGSAITQRSHLALLRDVSQLSNPRFGVDQTITSVLEKTRSYFNGRSCLLIMQDKGTRVWSLRSVLQTATGVVHTSSLLSDDAASPLLAFPHDKIALYNQPAGRWLPWTGGARMLDPDSGRWLRHDDAAGDRLAELLEAHAFISAPLPLRNGKGRIFIVSATSMSKTDALFLSHIGAQAFPVIENIDLLDRLASQAASREREKIARDLHDTAVQPYIGLRHGLAALRNEATPGNPLLPELEKLIIMSGQVIADLRSYARTFKNGQVQSEPELLVALRRQATQIREFYGIDIALQIEGDLHINDRLAAEVFQIVNEGMSNIRKHTSARHGAVKLTCVQGALHISIDNECAAAHVPDFLPDSLAERAAALGGTARVTHGMLGNTSVQIEIPI
ncbi:histidine kinase [Janthinobacterium sp. GW460P]|uniref:sensor histidine kinase n=1 Tax=unclassified Janthinobacterium TaxID=2610881 RepID=UPI00111C5990|nr:MULTISPECIES: histidine kinase [unclassified Janthinobacterium]MCC7702190.1 histidine kinase [Janthinobacterium sp. GW460P]MCC7707698.1 histidine kinase [Janthinobacterium sp. GW460W]